MNLSPLAVKAYLARPFNDFSVYKKLTNERLDLISQKYGVESWLWKKLRRHQKVMLLIALRAKRFAMWADTGLGKTFTVLSLARTMARKGDLQRMLVLVPRNANKEEWKEQIEKHLPSIKFCILPSNTEEKWRYLEESDATIFIETYAGLYWLACEKVKGKKGNKLKPSAKKVGALCFLFDALVMDESHNVKTKAKLPFRICRQIAKNCRTVLALSGTPHGRDPTDLWGQMMIVDGGETLGETLGLFRAVFFGERKGFWAKKYEFHKTKTNLLNRILNNRSIRFPAEQADLPKLVQIDKRFHLPEDAETYYQRARETILKAGYGNYREMKNAWLRMRQISSGFVGYHDDDEGETAHFVFDSNPKLELLLSLMEGIDAKAIVFYEFTYSGLLIAKKLSELGIEALHLWGGCKDQAALLHRFNGISSNCVLVMQSKFGEGLNLQAAKYSFFYESPVSPITRKQCQRRVERQHSLHPTVFQYDLICRDTVDEQILEFLKEGRDLFEAIIDGKTRLL